MHGDAFLQRARAKGCHQKVRMSLSLHNLQKVAQASDTHRQEKSMHTQAEESAETMKNEEAEDPIK